MNNDNITQAAANKAAEEGELPALKVLQTFWLGHEWAGVTCYDRERIEAAFSVLIAADRASRQVANKAEVEPVAYLVWRTVQRFDGDIDDWIEVGKKEDICDDGSPAFPVYATPPATTSASTARDQAGEIWNAIIDAREVGSSTALTDERIEWILRDLGVKAAGRGQPMTSIDFARAIEREVAAQAGQVASVPSAVAVPGKFANLKFVVDEYVKEDSKESDWSNEKLNRLQGEISQEAHPRLLQELLSMIAAPSPAKESK